MEASVLKHIHKIKKLLALSKSSNFHEATLAMEHAQRIMAEHNLTMSDVAASDVQTFSTRMARAKTPPTYLQSLSRMVGDAFGCVVILSTKGTWDGWETSACFVGIESSAELAGYAFSVLLRQITRDRKEFMAGIKRCKGGTKTRRADAFCEAWVFQARMKVQKLTLPKEQESALTSWMETLDLTEATRRKSKGLRKEDVGALLAGSAKGKEACLHAGVGAPARKSLA